MIDHWTTMRQQGGGFRASVAGIGGYVVARVLRRLTRQQPTLQRDPTFQHRLSQICGRHPAIAASCADLAQVRDVQSHDDAIVFVHGTVSSALQRLKDLCPAAQFRHSIYRYEHDTFLPIVENADELVRMIRASLRARRLLVVGHSRGGLVARIAVAQLRSDQYPGEVYLQTFGTPHDGTPLADSGGQFLNLAYTLGCEMIGSIPAISPAVAAYSYVINCPVLPPGIDVMRESSSALRVLNAVSDPTRTRCWGSAFNIANGPSGFGTFVTGALVGMMSGIDHDLVVPTASALAFGQTEPLLNCSHLDYFAQPAVQQAIGAIAPAAAVAAAAAAAAGDSKAQPQPATPAKTPKTLGGGACGRATGRLPGAAAAMFVAVPCRQVSRMRRSRQMSRTEPPRSAVQVPDHPQLLPRLLLPDCFHPPRPARDRLGRERVLDHLRLFLLVPLRRTR